MENENLNTPDCIRTYTGKYVNVFNPDPETICIEDIAHALSNLCRFGGHTPRFYSVAQHSLTCLNQARFDGITDNNVLLSILMHDAAEAYLCDLPRPIKKRITEYETIENNLMRVISDKYKFQMPEFIGFEKYDDAALKREWEWLLTHEETKLLCIPSHPTNIKEDFIESIFELRQSRWDINIY